MPVHCLADIGRNQNADVDKPSNFDQILNGSVINEVILFAH